MLIVHGFALNKYIENDTKVKHTDDDPIYADHYDAEALHEIQGTQHTIMEYYNILFFDDFADDPSFTRQT